jgi:hypothetical protein
MKMSERVQRRLRKDRPMTSISLRIPVDVIEDLKEIAPALGFTGYQALIKAYIGEGLRKHLAERESATQSKAYKLLLDSLLRHGVAPEVIHQAEEEAKSA